MCASIVYQLHSKGGGKGKGAVGAWEERVGEMGVELMGVDMNMRNELN